MFTAFITSSIASAAQRTRAWGAPDRRDLAQSKARGTHLSLAEERAR